MKNDKKALSALAALLIFAVFAIGILGVLLGGANTYRRLTQRNQSAYDSRTCIQYIATRVRQASSGANVRVESFGDCDALLIYDEIAGETYLTRVYCHDGWLMELFTAAEGGFAPEDGEKLLPAQALTFALTDGLITATLTDDDGSDHQLQLQLRG